MIIIEFLHFVIQVSLVSKIKVGRDFVPMKKVILQQVSCKDMCMIHGRVEIGKKKRRWRRERGRMTKEDEQEMGRGNIERGRRKRTR